jgi:hypothetical protein
LFDEPRFDICRYVDGATRALELHGTTARLLLQQKIDVRGEHCAAVTYQYRFQETDDPDSWLFRWEWFRKQPRADYDYPLAHFHINSELVGTNVSGMHFPTARVAIEQVVWGLIAEWGVESKSNDWREILTDSLEGFEERRRSV